MSWPDSLRATGEVLSPGSLFPFINFICGTEPMWCPSCRADVAAELSTDNRRMTCARCQTELGIAAAAAAAPQLASSPRSLETERDARELLARWSAQNLLDVPAPSLGVGPFAKPNGSTELPITRSELRFDLPQPRISGPSAPYLAAAIAKHQSGSGQPLPADHADGSHVAAHHPDDAGFIPEKRPRTKKSRASRLAQASVPESPAMNVAVPSRPAAPTEMAHDHTHHDEKEFGHEPAHQPVRLRSNWATLAGQLCAYAGVALLTCGSVLVMWSYFGGPPKFMPTGWLAAAVGQMLLFLGITTLISSGMDQTISEVGWRIDHLAEEVHHMGHALDELEHEHRTARLKRSRIDRHDGDDQTLRDAA